MTDSYLQFLASKAPIAASCGMDPWPIRAPLFDFQKKATEFCLRRGRAALFLDTGLGKTICESSSLGRLVITPMASRLS